MKLNADSFSTTCRLSNLQLLLVSAKTKWHELQCLIRRSSTSRRASKTFHMREWKTSAGDVVHTGLQEAGKSVWHPIIEIIIDISLGIK